MTARAKNRNIFKLEMCQYAWAIVWEKKSPSKDIAEKPFFICVGQDVRTRVMLYAPPPLKNNGGIKTSPETQNNFIGMFLIKLSIKIAPMSPLLWTNWLPELNIEKTTFKLSHWPNIFAQMLPIMPAFKIEQVVLLQRTNDRNWVGGIGEKSRDSDLLKIQQNFNIPASLCGWAGWFEPNTWTS